MPVSVLCGTAEELQAESFASLSVLLAEAAPCAPRRAQLARRSFLRGAVPMTKQMVRAAVLAQLGAAERGVYWDVGAGTGSVSVELAVQCRRGAVYAVERRSEACALIRANREKFCAWNLRVVEGRAPEALEELPAPEGVFVGGGGGALDAIVAAALQKKCTGAHCDLRYRPGDGRAGHGGPAAERLDAAGGAAERERNERRRRTPFIASKQPGVFDRRRGND